MINTSQQFRKFVLETTGAEFWVPKNYTVEAEIGSGSFGAVCKVRNDAAVDDEPTHYAIKKITWSEYLLQHGAVDLKTLREIITLSHTRGHPNIVMLYDVYIGPGQDERSFTDVYLVLELMDTDMRQFITTNPMPLPEKTVATLMYQLLRALAHLRKCNIIHRDVATKNVLMDRTGIVRLTDFGLAREDSEGPKSAYVVTRWYRAPENVSLDNDYSFQTDVFAAGVVMTELFLGRPLFYTDPHSGQSTRPADQLMMRMKYLGRPADDRLKSMASDAAVKWVQKHRPSLEPSIDLREHFSMASDDAFAVMRALLQFHPSDRPTAEEAMRMPFFDAIREELEHDFDAAEEVPPLNSNYETEARRIGVRSMMLRAVDQLRAAEPYTRVQCWF
eukprot:PhM_4_TR116/c0_g1_i1/m.14487